MAALKLNLGTLKRRLVTSFFIFFMVTQFLIGLPASFGLAGTLWPLTRIFETMGIKQRWYLFTHSSDDEFHAWSQIFFTVRVSDQSGLTRQWKLPELPDGFYERYVHAREVDFMKSFWAVKNYVGIAFARAHARAFLDEFPEAKYPLSVTVLQNSERIHAPLTFFVEETYITEVYKLHIREDQRRCSERDSL